MQNIPMILYAGMRGIINREKGRKGDFAGRVSHGKAFYQGKATGKEWNFEYAYVIMQRDGISWGIMNNRERKQKQWSGL